MVNLTKWRWFPSHTDGWPEHRPKSVSWEPKQKTNATIDKVWITIQSLFTLATWKYEAVLQLIRTLPMDGPNDEPYVLPINSLNIRAMSLILNKQKTAMSSCRNIRIKETKLFENPSDFCIDSCESTWMILHRHNVLSRKRCWKLPKMEIIFPSWLITDQLWVHRLWH